MTNATPLVLEPRFESPTVTSRAEANASGVSWPAVASGAFVSAALAMVLLSLGAGLGLSSVSPWSNAGASATAIGAAGIGWLIAMQMMSSAMGGYVAGRLRTKWTTIHTDEVYFRDTAHGLLVWSVGVVITAGFLAASALSMVGAGGQAAERRASAANADPNAYYVDMLFRSTRMDPSDGPIRAEASRIFSAALAAKEMSEADQGYLTSLVANRTGISEVQAGQRMNSVLAEARTNLDKGRKTTAHLLLWTFIALLIGAFCASYAATIGGRQRDEVKLIPERRVA